MIQHASPSPPKVLTIGGSDSGGAAGIQADLKTWTALAVYGMSAITAVTAQNSTAITAVHYLPPNLVSAQITAVLSDYDAAAIKTGFIGKSQLVAAVASSLQEYEPGSIVIDPVLVSHKGQPMFHAEVVTAYRRSLIPLATLITPNWPEALLLVDLPPSSSPSPQNIDVVLSRLHKIGAPAVLLKGIKLDDSIVDYFSQPDMIKHFSQPWLETNNRHGSGDTLSAAICAYLAKGESLINAIRKAQQFTHQALQAARNWKLGHGHGPLSHFPP